MITENTCPGGISLEDDLQTSLVDAVLSASVLFSERKFPVRVLPNFSPFEVEVRAAPPQVLHYELERASACAVPAHVPPASIRAGDRADRLSVPR